MTCFWYIRTVDPQTALLTGLTRDGVFLVERGEVKGAVNNFRWNMSPIAALAQATQIGRGGMALPREHDEFLRAKAPPLAHRALQHELGLAKRVNRHFIGRLVDWRDWLDCCAD